MCVRTKHCRICICNQLVLIKGNLEVISRGVSLGHNVIATHPLLWSRTPWNPFVGVALSIDGQGGKQASCTHCQVACRTIQCVEFHSTNMYKT